MNERPRYPSLGTRVRRFADLVFGGGPKETQRPEKKIIDAELKLAGLTASGWEDVHIQLTSHATTILEYVPVSVVTLKMGKVVLAERSQEMKDVVIGLEEEWSLEQVDAYCAELAETTGQEWTPLFPPQETP